MRTARGSRSARSAAALCVLLVVGHCIQQAAAAGPLRQHKHPHRMRPEQQLQRAADGSNLKQDAAAAQVPAGPLLPDCVPKYVTDLVLPPPMPLATRPLAAKGDKPVVSGAPKKKAAKRTTKGATSVAAEDVEAAETEEGYANSAEQSWAEVASLPQHVAGDAEQRQQQVSLQGVADLLEDADLDQAEVEFVPRKPGQDASQDEDYERAMEEWEKRLNERRQAKKQRKAVDKKRASEPSQVPAGQDNYHVSARQIVQQVLPPTPPNVGVPGCPATPLFGTTDVLAYGPGDVPGTAAHNWPGFTIEAQRNRPVHIKWSNGLMDANFNYLPHILRDSIDQTIHWANPAGLGGSTDSSPCHACRATGTCANDPDCMAAITTTYTGPVPISTHVHGQNHVPDYSDGYTEAWFLPNAFGIEGDFKSVGTWYPTFEQRYNAATGLTWSQGSSTGVYPNTQRTAPLWYHDHTLGLTRTNVYAGLAGFYFVRDKFPSLANGPELPGLPFPANDGIVDPTLIRELPLAIQDRAFLDNSQLWYPVNGLPPSDVLPVGQVPPKWIPEFSATVDTPAGPVNMLMMTVNGRTYPRQTVYPDAYRLRILNGCNARTMQLRFAVSTNAQINPLATADTADLLPFWVVGNEGGFFPELQAPVTVLEMGPAERYDVVIDFLRLLPGQFVFMLNNGPETDTAIYDGTNNGVGLTVHTAQIMRFDVQPLPAGQTAQPFDLAQQTALNAAMIAAWTADVPPIPLVPPPGAPIRRVALVEELFNGSPTAVLLGVADSPTTAIATPWTAPVTANAHLNVVQYWDIINLSADSHPIHLHDVDFRYLGRTATTVVNTGPPQWSFTETTTPVPNADLDSLLVMPCTTDPSGLCPVPKDTMIVLPGTTTRIAFYGAPASGVYVWHCHLVEHEDNEMMVPMCMGQPNITNPATGLLMCPGPN